MALGQIYAITSRPADKQEKNELKDLRGSGHILTHWESAVLHSRGLQPLREAVQVKDETVEIGTVTAETPVRIPSTPPDLVMQPHKCEGQQSSPAHECCNS